ncbi:MAG: hypothetical protein ACRC2R_05385 [Xenococcaceae cyanobacterium]
MSIDHKAYVFNYDRFQIELKDIIEEALASGNPNELITFIKNNLSYLKDPCEGKPLDGFWQDAIGILEVDNYGDFALTKFYQPQNCIGLGDKWSEIDDLLCFEFGELSLITLGKLLGTKENYFDPGKMGSYFQSPQQVQTNLIRLEDTLEQRPELLQHLVSVVNMLKEASNLGKGLYVTF